MRSTRRFLLERELRGSPPKSEKRRLLGKHLKSSWGERGRGAALFCKKNLAKLGARESQILRKILQKCVVWLIEVGKREDSTFGISQK